MSLTAARQLPPCRRRKLRQQQAPGAAPAAGYGFSGCRSTYVNSRSFCEAERELRAWKTCFAAAEAAMPATKSSPRGRPELEGRREPFFRPNRGSWAARVPEWRRTEAIYSRELNIELLEPDAAANYTPTPPRRQTPRSARSSRARTLALSQPKVHSPRPPQPEDVPTPPKSSRARSRAASRSRCRRLSTPKKDYAPEPVHKKRGTKQQIMEQQETIRDLVARMHPKAR